MEGRPTCEKNDTTKVLFHIILPPALEQFMVTIKSPNLELILSHSDNVASVVITLIDETKVKLNNIKNVTNIAVMNPVTILNCQPIIVSLFA